MVSIVRVPATDISPERLDTGYYSDSYYRTIERVANAGYELEPLGNICDPWQFGAYALCNEIVWSDEKNGIPFIKAEAIDSPLIDHNSLSYITKKTHYLLSKSALKAGDIIISTSGTVGRLAVLSESIPVANSNQDTIKFCLDGTNYDPHYVAAWLMTKYAQSFMCREAGGAVQQHIYLYNFKRLPLLKINKVGQTYAGDKVRQAEQLRALAKNLAEKLATLTSNSQIDKACWTTQRKHNRPKFEDITDRLDPKYYGNREIAVNRVVKSTGIPLFNLTKSINNGFEERHFVDHGIEYLTVTEVSAGRLDLRSAPRISFNTIIPDKARIHESCVLVVRTGSIGTAVKVDTRDRDAVISSHFIRLEFEDEATAAAIAAFLNSNAGKVLQHKISYGAVQPQIGQDELLSLSIPKFVLESKDSFLEIFTKTENATRIAQSLVDGAKMLVESLIEGQIDENLLISAQNQLQSGNNSLDRDILSRLKTDGMDGQGQPLFPDIDLLYDLLAKAQEAA